MRVLCVGDVVGDPGVECLCRLLPPLRRELGAQVVVVNAENADRTGTGLSRQLARRLLDGGYADVLTTGNHCLRRADLALYEEEPRVLCPANHPAAAPECGRCRLDLGAVRMEVYVLQGSAFIEPLQNPALTLDTLLREADTPLRILDFHAEATAEKKAMGFYADGRLSAMFGTHTHVQTADEQILPGGTGYITDAGMTGPVCSVLGVQPHGAIQRQLQRLPARFCVAQGPCALEGVLFTLEDTTGRCKAVQRIRRS